MVKLTSKTKGEIMALSYDKTCAFFSTADNSPYTCSNVSKTNITTRLVMKQNVSVAFGVLFLIFGLLLMTFICNQYSFTTNDNNNLKKHRLILIVLDALRHDYLEVTKSRGIDLVNLNKMAANGARSMQVIAVFPTSTFPNHQTMVTGLHAPYHGITHNIFNDSSMGYEEFSMDNQTSLNEARWYKGYPDPIWVSCEKNAYCKSASMLWPHTDAVFNGYRPFRYVSQYTALNQRPNVVYPFERRVDELINWIKKDLIDFGLLYFDEPDFTSHEFGPLHNETLHKLKEMDGYIGRLMSGLEDEGLLERTDIIVTGDHGMTEMSLDRVINIDDFVPPSWYKSTYSYPVGIIYPNKDKFDEVFQLYSNASSHIKVYKRESLPADLYYTDNPRRISPIVTVVDQGWFVNCSHYQKRFYKGFHGYSPYNDDMKASLLAMGPSFKNTVVNVTHQVDLYSLMMHMLGLRANPNNGSYERISPFLKEDKLKFTAIEDKWHYNSVIILLFVLLLAQIILPIVFGIMALYGSFHLIVTTQNMSHFDYEDMIGAVITSFR